MKSAYLNFEWWKLAKCIDRFDWIIALVRSDRFEAMHAID